MNIYVADNLSCINDIAEIHMKTFPDFFLTFLGRGFLKALYGGFVMHSSSNIIIASENGATVGFCAYSENLSGLYKFLIKKKLPVFAWYAARAFIRKPKVLFRLLRAFEYSDKSKRSEPYIELSSVGVSPDSKNKGIGSMMIEKLFEISDTDLFKYIKLETDADDNEAANYFYLKNNFVLDRSYVTPEGRRMNEYRYYLNKL